MLKKEDTAFLEKIMGVPPEECKVLKPVAPLLVENKEKLPVLQESRAEAPMPDKEFRQLIEALAKQNGIPLEEFLGLDKLWNYITGKSGKTLSRIEPKGVSLQFMAAEDANKIVGKNIIAAVDYLDSRLARCLEGDTSVLISPIVREQFSNVEKEAKRLDQELKSLRSIFAKVEGARSLLVDWYDKTVKEVVAQQGALYNRIKDMIGGQEVGKTTYDSAPEAIRKQLDLALTMRQVGINVMEWKLPAGAEGVGRSPELSGGRTVPDENTQQTSKMWSTIIDSLGAAIPMKYGGDLVPKHLVAEKVAMVISDIGQSGTTLFRFKGTYTLQFHKKPKRPELLTVQMELKDICSFSGLLGETSHNCSIVNFSFPNIKEELYPVEE